MSTKKAISIVAFIRRVPGTKYKWRIKLCIDGNTHWVVDGMHKGIAIWPNKLAAEKYLEVEIPGAIILRREK